MSTISTEQAKDLRNAFECWQQDYDPVEDKEQYEMFGLGVVAMDELLALRKERERAEPNELVSELLDIAKRAAEEADECANAEFSDNSMKHAREIAEWERRAAMLAAPGADDDSLPYDTQIAEYEQMMEAELKAAADMEHKPKSELSQMAEKLVRDTTALAEKLSAEIDTTSQQFESLAGKAVVPAGWKLVPIEPTFEMQIAFAEAWFSKVRCVDDCELEDAYIAMLAAAPEPCK
ncbi:hypothetical protein FZH95_22460 [Cronobacter sakazakii]|nr:hypothetical protein FZH95_22460 [Cronobacter sakazakii]